MFRDCDTAGRRCGLPLRTVRAPDSARLVHALLKAAAFR
jgi:hypothetical protein